MKRWIERGVFLLAAAAMVIAAAAVPTRRVQEALATIGVELLDHIIVAEDDYVSLADSGILQR